MYKFKEDGIFIKVEFNNKTILVETGVLNKIKNISNSSIEEYIQILEDYKNTLSVEGWKDYFIKDDISIDSVFGYVLENRGTEKQKKDITYELNNMKIKYLTYYNVNQDNINETLKLKISLYDKIYYIDVSLLIEGEYSEIESEYTLEKMNLKSNINKDMLFDPYFLVIVVLTKYGYFDSGTEYYDYYY